MGHRRARGIGSEVYYLQLPTHASATSIHAYTHTHIPTRPLPFLPSSFTFTPLKYRYVIFSSDHGYSLGQFRLPSHKMQVYENNLRVPFLVRGPGIAPNTTVTQMTQFADLAPTILQVHSILLQ